MSDQPLNDAWDQGADGKWYPPDQQPDAVPPDALWGRAARPSPATPPVPSRSSTRMWLAVAVGGLLSLIVLAVIGGAIADEPAEVDASARPAPSTTSELGRTTSTIERDDLDDHHHDHHDGAADDGAVHEPPATADDRSATAATATAAAAATAAIVTTAARGIRRVLRELRSGARRGCCSRATRATRLRVAPGSRQRRCRV